MAFTWKDRKDIYKGEGIYFLTFVVVGRKGMLGTLMPLAGAFSSNSNIAKVEATELGNRVYHELNALQARHRGLQVLAKQVMPDHFHAVVWCHEDFEGSIKMVARGFAQACSRIAREMYRRAGRAGCAGRVGCALLDSAPINGMTAAGGASGCAAGALDGAAGSASVSSMFVQSDCTKNALSQQSNPYECGNGANTLFNAPFIRTLAHRGQLRAMIDYTHANPDNAWRRKCHPDLYVIRRNQQRAGLHFDMMGKVRLLDYPDRNIVALSRSLTKEQIAREVADALHKAERGTVTYTAAISEGEKFVARAVREAAFPLVILMLDGFPKEGTEAARYFHPSGVYHTACGEGRLLLMAPLESNYSNERLIGLTEEALESKAKEKGFRYFPIPHTSTRWRMVAGNVMLRMVGDG